MVAFVLFGISLASACVIVALSFVSIVRRDIQFWPPPGAGTWQHRTFLLLFRGFLYPLIALTIVELEPLVSVGDIVRAAAGSVLFAVGFGLALALTLSMGWRNAFGEKRGLCTTGWFARSRNPIYVATWIGLLGWGLIANAWLVTVLLTIWALLYAVALVLEEQWLEREYGTAYHDYKKSVPRFL